jgi:lipopolysaccharide/colanic/teichoic acid biosynthesis glycosyltransferase
VTKGGATFRMIKFRTMYENADELLAPHDVDLTAPFFKLERDPRLTRVGRVLRRLSLDELPQLWNVARGDMSIVGPRPLPADQVEANRDLLEPRLEVHAGMTGWWQVHGRSNVLPEESIKLDIFYIENWSLTLDLYILLKTLGAVARGTGAF